MSQRRQRLYRRLDRAERAAIERGLDKNRPARAMARDLGRSQSSVADEVRRNRTVTRGPGKGSRVESVPEGACARLRGWPHVCNGCNKRRYHCSMLPPMYFPPFTPMIHNRSRQPAPAGYANVFPPLSAPPSNLSRNARASRARALSEPG